MLIMDSVNQESVTISQWSSHSLARVQPLNTQIWAGILWICAARHVDIGPALVITSPNGYSNAMDVRTYRSGSIYDMFLKHISIGHKYLKPHYHEALRYHIQCENPDFILQSSWPSKYYSHFHNSTFKCSHLHPALTCLKRVVHLWHMNNRTE